MKKIIPEPCQKIPSSSLSFYNFPPHFIVMLTLSMNINYAFALKCHLNCTFNTLLTQKL